MKKIFSSKLFLSYSIMLFTVLSIIFLFSIYTLSRNQYEKNILAQLDVAKNIQDQMDTSLKDMDSIINGLMFNKRFINIIKSNFNGSFTESDSQEILNYFAALDAPNFQAHRIIFFSDNFYYNWSQRGEEPYYMKVATRAYRWKKEISAANGKKVISSPHADPFTPNINMIYSVSRSVTDGTKPYGIIEVQYDYDILEQICELTQISGQIMIMNTEGELIYSISDDEYTKSLLSEYNNFANKNSDMNNGYFTIDDEFVVFIHSEYSDWITLISAPTVNLLPLPYRPILYFSIFFLIFACCLVIIFFLTNKLVTPLIELNTAISQVSLDNLTLCLPKVRGINEIDNINNSFQSMFKYLEQSIALSIQSRANESHAKYLALESQMNPHTLYNSLNLIESVCYQNGDFEASNLCICFSKMMRYLSDYRIKDYTVKEELDHLNNYISLIQMRFSDNLNITVEIDEIFFNNIIPKFTLQPLVENAVQHGMNWEKTSLNINVRIIQITNGWTIEIEDDGNGFTHDRLMVMLNKIKTWDDSFHHGSEIINAPIGELTLINIFARCRILYKDNFSFSIKNNLPEDGVCIILSFIDELDNT